MKVWNESNLKCERPAFDKPPRSGPSIRPARRILAHIDKTWVGQERVPPSFSGPSLRRLLPLVPERYTVAWPIPQRSIPLDDSAKATSRLPVLERCQFVA